MNTSTEELSRIEVIDETGRAYVRGSIYNDPVLAFSFTDWSGLTSICCYLKLLNALAYE